MIIENPLGFAYVHGQNLSLGEEFSGWQNPDELIGINTFEYSPVTIQRGLKPVVLNFEDLFLNLSN